ncbi:MAG TPA: flagellar M-ring protein FliF, partial [Oribacterium sp.]|nr:flagellar M-ring protein FliF [Oribacterium sp.]
MNNVKESWQNMPKKNKIAIISIIVATLLVAAGVIFYLNANNKTSYGTLFTGLNQEEATQITGLLQNKGIPYTYNNKDGSISVPEEQVDQTRVDLLSQGYPKSGFTYNMYISNAGLMTTESDKQLYTLYDLQDRLGATIRLFDGVQDAKVTIAQGNNDKFALNSSKDSIDASASAVVTMKEGATLNQANADAIRNLISHSVKGVNFTNVSVFDAATMTEVGSSNEESGSGASVQNLTTQIEQNIALNIKRVLGKLYGIENVAVSVKGTLDMSRLIEENTEYSVPSQVDPQDRSGLLSHEEVAGENSNNSGDNAAGVVGSDANADVPRYTNQNGTGTSDSSYASNSASRDWLFNVLKQQREVSPGLLQDTSVAVVVNTADRSVQEQDLINLVADAAGISRENAPNKITIVRSAPEQDETAAAAEDEENKKEEEQKQGIPTAILIAIIAASVLLLLILILLILRRRKKKKLAKLAAEQAAAEEAAAAQRAAEEAAAA